MTAFWVAFWILGGLLAIVGMTLTSDRSKASDADALAGGGGTGLSKPTAPATPLPEALVSAASEEARKIASMITRTDPMKWEIEGDHCHYHASPRMTFVYPASGRVYTSPGYSDSGRPLGLFKGDQDIAMYDKNGVLIRNGADEALIMHAVQIISDRRRAEKQRRAEAAATANKRQFMADVDRYLG